MPKYWEDSADLSRDSSAESDEDLEEVAEEHAEPQDGSKGRATEESRRNNLQREQTAISQTESIEEVQRDSHVDETVSRLLASNATQPSLEPHQHASLFYLSLIEGRCRSQAANSINQDRTLEAHVTENSPEVEILAEHMFGEMIKELSKAGMVPEEFVHRPVSELRSYLRSFDSILQVLATPLQTLSLHPGNREIDDNFESGFMQSLSSLPNTNAAPARTQLLSTKSSAIEFPSTSDIFDRSAEVNEANKGFSPHSGTVLGRTQDLISQSDFTDSIASAFGILDQSQALIPRNQSGVILPNTFLGHGTPFSFTDAHVTDFSLPKSVFATEYRTTALLGQGGFGKVVKVRSKLDMAEYAVKRIKYPAAKVRQLAERGRMQDLLNEVQALAKYNHQHIVRYYHAWVETQPSVTHATDVWMEDDRVHPTESSPSHTSTRKSSLLNSVVTDIANIALEDQQAIDDVLRVQQQNAAAFDVNNTHVVFESQTSIPRTTRSFFRSALEPESPSDSDEDDKMAQVTHSDDGTGSTISLSRIQTTDTALIPQGNGSIVPSFTDCFIYIKMAPYPLTLADFINPPSDHNLSCESTDLQPRHCFHSLPAIRLLLRTLSGLAYLHRKKQIHRDLKPANIFLSILEEGEPPDKAWVDVSDCPDCASLGRQRTPCYVSPCIGDFGLVVDLKVLEDDITVPDVRASADVGGTLGSASQMDAQPKTPGTKLYIPPNQSTHNIICPKLDTYALGVILMELLYQFDTRSERMIVLDKARQGDWPPNLHNHELAEAVMGMMEPDRVKRWGCEGVLMWAEKMENSILDRVHRR